jgi:hypothetical protein
VLFISAADWQVYVALRAARYRQELELTVLNQALRRSMDGLVPFTSYEFIILCMQVMSLIMRTDLCSPWWSASSSSSRMLKVSPATDKSSQPRGLCRSPAMSGCDLAHPLLDSESATSGSHCSCGASDPIRAESLAPPAYAAWVSVAAPRPDAAVLLPSRDCEAVQAIMQHHLFPPSLTRWLFWTAPLTPQT